MENRFDGKIVAITGAGGGLGGQFVEEFCALGARVFGCDVREETLGRLRQLGATAAVVDLSNSREAAEWVAGIEKAAGGAIDVLVNNAGGTTAAPGRFVEDVPDEEWDRIFAANVRATFYVCRAAVPAMKRARKGRIINISSGAGIAASRTKVHAYTAAKHATVGLTRQMAAELGEFGVTVNSVAPGFVISTPYTRQQWESIPPEGQRAHLEKTFMRRVGKLEDISNAVLFLASERSSWISGQVLSINGGMVGS